MMDDLLDASLGAGNSGVEAPFPPMSVRNRTVTMLLVEDETLVRRLMADILGDAGFRVIKAANVGMALNWLEADEDVQVLFTDVHMPPGIDGLELARRVHERWPEVRLVIASGLARPRAEEIAGRGTFIPKPCRPERVVQAIEQAATGATPSA
jgi:two-component system, response regulator PdtaR